MKRARVFIVWLLIGMAIGIGVAVLANHVAG